MPLMEQIKLLNEYTRGKVLYVASIFHIQSPGLFWVAGLVVAGSDLREEPIFSLSDIELRLQREGNSTKKNKRSVMGLINEMLKYITSFGKVLLISHEEIPWHVNCYGVN